MVPLNCVCVCVCIESWLVVARERDRMLAAGNLHGPRTERHHD